MDNYPDLKNDINAEIENFYRLVKEMKKLLTNTKDDKNFIEVKAAGSILHDFYCGIEKTFERIAIVIDKSLPKGENWHIELLLQMANPFKGIRDRVVSEGLTQKLKEYLRFRHLFRHIYGFELKWNRIKPLCIEMENVLEKIKQEIDRFFKC